MVEAVVVTIISGLILAAILAVARHFCKDYKLTRQKKALVSWLRATTRDEPGESHRSVSEAANELGISPEEVNRLVSQTEEIFRSQSKPELISIWRKEPESVYETRGILMI